MSHESLQKRKMMPRESEPSISKASRSETTKIRTRDRLEEAERRLAEITSTRTRENLRLVEEKIAREQAKVTSNQTMAVFRRKQAMLQQMLEKNKNVDVVFVLDCTGSMSGYIDGIKNQIKDIVGQVSRVYENRIRVGFVGYRDHCDGPLRINSLQLSGDVSAFSAFLNNVFAIGGGDAPEDVLGGLEAAVNMAWSPDSASKVIFHVGDSPQHGARFHDFGPNADNSYYGADPRGVVPEDIFRRMKDLGVRYVFGRVNTGTDKMFAEFLRIGGTEMVKKVDMSNPNLLKRQAVASIEATIEDSLAATVNMVRLEGISHGNKTLKNFRISKTEPGSLKESHLEPQKEVHWLECTINAQDNIRDIKEKIGSIDHKWSNKMVKKALQPFAEGTQRISYHGMRMDYNEGADHERIVLKEFKHTGSGRDRRSDYMEIMETQCVAAFMASEFNKVAPSGSKRISFLDVSKNLDVSHIVLIFISQR